MNDNIEKLRENIFLLGNDELKRLVRNIPLNDLIGVWDD